MSSDRSISRRNKSCTIRYKSKQVLFPTDTSLPRLACSYLNSSAAASPVIRKALPLLLTSLNILFQPDLLFQPCLLHIPSFLETQWLIIVLAV